MLYTVFLLRDPSRPGCAGLVAALTQADEAFASASLNSFGVFTPLFGLASNEVYLIVTGTGDFKPIAQSLDITIVDQHCFRSTIRPIEHKPRSRPGVYVFRWFAIKSNAADEIVRLSGEAWPSFEGEFETEVQGLFVEDNPAPENMLLLTWYRDLSVWEASRSPQPSARENFLKRHQLTTSATPIATMLAGTELGISMVSHS